MRRHSTFFLYWVVVVASMMLFPDGVLAQEQCPAGDATCQEPAAKKQGGGGSVWKIPKNPLGQARWAALKARRGYGTRIVSNFLQDTSLLETLTDHRLWFACYEETRGSHTHWLDKDAKPNNWMEHVAVEMWRDQPILKNQTFAGYEIWCNILTPEGPLVWHVDKDQIAFQESRGRNLSVPLYGSVFYGYPHSFEGGYLEMLPYDPATLPDDDDQDIDTTQAHRIERLKAEYNRLVIFNASKFHRVSPITSGARVTLAVNVWKERPRVADLQHA